MRTEVGNDYQATAISAGVGNDTLNVVVRTVVSRRELMWAMIYQAMTPFSAGVGKTPFRAGGWGSRETG